MDSDQLRSDLNNCETVEDMLKHCLDSYDLTMKPGLLVKPALIKGFSEAMVMLRPKPKADATG